MKTEKPIIFISYSHQDIEFAEKIDDCLTTAGFVTWRDKKEIVPGDDWPDSINEGLQTCQIMILIQSPDAQASNQVNREWKEFVAKNKKVIPVLYREARFNHYFVNNIEYVSFVDQDFQTAFAKLLSALEKHIQKSQPEDEQNTKPEVSSQNHSPRKANRKILYGFIVILLFFGIAALAISSALRQSNSVLTEPTFGSPSNLETTTSTPSSASFLELVYQDQHMIRYISSSSEIPENHLLTVHTENARQPVWSPDGTQVAFLSSQQTVDLEQHLIHIIDMTGEITSDSQRTVYGTGSPLNCLRWVNNTTLMFTRPSDTGIEIFQLTLNLEFENVNLVRLASIEAGVFESCPTLRYNAFIYSANRDGDAELYLLNQISGQEIQLTQNTVDDLMPEIGGKRPSVIFYQSTPDPEVYSVAIMSIMSIAIDRPQLPLNWQADYLEVLFETKRMSRFSWGIGGYDFSFGYESPYQNLGGLATYCITLCPPIGSGPALLTNITFDGTNPDRRPSPR